MGRATHTGLRNHGLYGLQNHGPYESCYTHGVTKWWTELSETTSWNKFVLPSLWQVFQSQRLRVILWFLSFEVSVWLFFSTVYLLKFLFLYWSFHMRVCLCVKYMCTRVGVRMLIHVKKLNHEARWAALSTFCLSLRDRDSHWVLSSVGSQQIPAILLPPLSTMLGSHTPVRPPPAF